LRLDGSTASLAGAVKKATGEARVGAVAGGVASSTAELSASLGDHSRDAGLTASVDGAQVLSEDGGHEGRRSDDELHFCWFWRMAG